MVAQETVAEGHGVRTLVRSGYLALGEALQPDLGGATTYSIGQVFGIWFAFFCLHEYILYIKGSLGGYSIKHFPGFLYGLSS